MQFARLLSLALVAGALGVIGCSSSSGGSTIVPIKNDTGVDSKTDTNTTSGNDSGSTTDTATGPTCDVDAGTNCTTDSCGDSNTCFECYINSDMTGYQAYVTALTSACACATGATCYSACSATDVCGGAATDHTACINCVNGLAASDACNTTFATKCKASSACLAFANGANSACP